jgi:hypothetical protein
MTARSNTGRDGGPAATGERYVLFAGTQRSPHDGLGKPVDTFTSEEAARRAFCDLRLRMSSASSWAQLAVVDDRDGLKPVCWFGIGSEPVRDRPRPASESAPRPTTKVAERPQRPTRASWLLAFVRRTGGQGRRRTAA